MCRVVQRRTVDCLVGYFVVGYFVGCLLGS